MAETREHSVDGCSLGCAVLIVLLILSMFGPGVVRGLSKAYWEGRSQALEGNR